MIKILVENIVGKPKEQGEICYFSVPADPIDMEMNVIYHKGIFEGILRRLGYTPRAIIEGHAVVFSELADEDFTGIGISCGGGLFNVCVCYKTVPAIAFSISRGGDWIDENVARVTGIPVSRATLLKERGVDLMNPKNRVEEAIVIYYRNLINYTLENLKKELTTSRSMPTFPESISIVCSGGTTLIKGFREVFSDEFKRIDFPLEIKEIRRAADPLNSVARGALIAAISEK
jgi:cell division ATPase FtsA